MDKIWKLNILLTTLGQKNVFYLENSSLVLGKFDRKAIQKYFLNQICYETTFKPRPKAQ